ncbi:MAG: F0F1 ATP synthase subunit C [Desemzia incerta]|uniref:ATP synthase subunit c n=1 Tax=Desemzia incerta TaxID=82801 RepID=A0A1I5V3H8_9LACT|nr:MULTISPECIES: F0F1 ATP synthase subunit C [Desemzia]MCI3027849.1 F0F1 ATP synthase subunit C [Desemzia sp. C1]WHZ32097.1 F0F1 ATP synthase subunit C [Desemzia incerta]SFQ01932.1 F-type H+-transporting ATPase subunit c [Desemzia incerta]
MNLIGAAIAVAGAAIGAALGSSRVISKALESIARQPEMKGELQTLMYIGVGLVEAIPIMGVVIAFILVFQ